MTSIPRRYFINNLCDFVGETVDIPRNFLKTQCLNYIQHIFRHQSLTEDDCDGGLYVGLAGVGYMSYYLSQHPDFSEHKEEFFAKSQEYMACALSYIEKPQVKADRSHLASFILGACGCYAVSALLMNAAGNDKACNTYLQSYASAADICTPVSFLRCGSDELFVGRAGYLSGILSLEKILGSQVVPEEKIFTLCQAMVESGSDYSRKRNSPSPLMYANYDTEYLGAAHGLSAILQILISFPNYLARYPDAEQKIKRATDFLLSLQSSSGNFPYAMDEVAHPRSLENELIHWCHGAPGVVYLMAKAYLRWKEDKYLRSCLECGEVVWRRGLLKKGPGICHGIAGSGYTFLLLYRLTHDKKHLHRAIQFANFLFEEEFKAACVPDNPLSLYEGLSGTVCFLADLLQPETAHFPLFDIF